MSAPLRVLLTGGGTGGHVYPALAVVDTVLESGTPAEFLYVGTATGLEHGIVTPTATPYASVAASAVRGRSPVALVRSIVQNLRGVIQARQIIQHFRPDVVLATGGFVCVPAVLAARLAGVSSVVYLPDLRPGWAVRFLSRIATAVAVSFDEVVPYVPARRIVVTGYPVRPIFSRWTSTSAKRSLGLPDNLPLVLVIGASQGARSINESIVKDARRLLDRATVLHVSGPRHFDSVEAEVRKLPDAARERYHLYPYLTTELPAAMVASTIVVSRAGASTLGEIPAAGTVGVLVPYPHAGAHQALNGQYLAQRGAAVVVTDADALAGGLVPTVLELLDDDERRLAMADASRQLARPDAAMNIFTLLNDVASAKRAWSRGGTIA